jgi:hypothetical protein
VQALRIRAQQVERVKHSTDLASGSSTGPGSLMDLLTGNPEAANGVGTSGFRDMTVLFERMARDDQWILCARSVFGEADISRLAATVASGMGINASAIAAMMPGGMQPQDVAPILCLEL